MVRVIPSILQGRREAVPGVDEFVACHVQETGSKLMERSQVIAEAVRHNKAAIVFVTYRLADGRVELRGHIGDIGEYPRPDDTPGPLAQRWAYRPGTS